MKSTINYSLHQSKDKQEQNSYSLLISTKKDLHCIVACVLQTDVKEANRYTSKVGKVLASKFVGASTAGGLIGLVSTFGTAGNGTAISGLSGAAATNATMTWIGGIIGGSMLAGTVLTGGFVIVVGAYTYRFMSSKARDYAKLEKDEREIVDKCILLIRYIDELIEKLCFPSQLEMRNLLDESIYPLNTLLHNAQEEILARLDITNQVIFKARAVPTFNKLIQRYKNFILIKDGQYV